MVVEAARPRGMARSFHQYQQSALPAASINAGHPDRPDNGGLPSSLVCLLCKGGGGTQPMSCGGVSAQSGASGLRWGLGRTWRSHPVRTLSTRSPPCPTTTALSGRAYLSELVREGCPRFGGVHVRDAL
jgi:hypothetical protein